MLQAFIHKQHRLLKATSKCSLPLWLLQNARLQYVTGASLPNDKAIFQQLLQFAPHGFSRHAGGISDRCGIDCSLALDPGDGRPIPGLYAAGNDMCSVTAGTYPGPGITLGPALTFGVLAAEALLGSH